ncbi:MAG: 2-oxoacid:acceptor oxidoreductase family protein [Armatimonadota bacterium]|nr:MAG: 2-oxoacid:acceptor oxidoreductase family protein [Armatimonadota bacterium]
MSDSTASLPRTNEFGYFEMRFESIGALGANLAGQMLAEALVLRQGFNGANFSSYGAEKKGSPVKAYVRVCAPDCELRTNSPVEEPHLLALFHDGLFALPGLLRGVKEDTVIIANTARDPVLMRQLLKAPVLHMGVVDALRIANEEKTRVNTAMLGAVTKASGFIDPQAVRDTIAETFQARYPAMVEPNIRTFDRGHDELVLVEFEDTGGFEPASRERYTPDLGYENAPIGGAVTNGGNTVRRNLGSSRQGYIPQYHRDRCIDCGRCEMTCPDNVFIFHKGEDKRGKPAMVMKGPDYRYCKGCMRCVEICPVEALTQMDDLPELVCTSEVELVGPPEHLASVVREKVGIPTEPDEDTAYRRIG